MITAQCSRKGASPSSIVFVPNSVNVLSPRVGMFPDWSARGDNPAVYTQHHVRKPAHIQLGLQDSELFPFASAIQYTRNAVMSLAHLAANHTSHATSASTVMATARCPAGSRATSCHAQSDAIRHFLVVTNVLHHCAKLWTCMSLQ